MTRAFRWWSGLDRASKAVAALVVIAGALLGLGRLVFASREDVVTSEAFRAHEAASGEVHAAMDADLDLLHQTSVRLSTSVDHLHEELRATREDLRAMDRGARLPPLAKEPRR